MRVRRVRVRHRRPVRGRSVATAARSRASAAGTERAAPPAARAGQSAARRRGRQAPRRRAAGTAHCPTAGRCRAAETRLHQVPGLKSPVPPAPSCLYYSLSSAACLEPSLTASQFPPTGACRRARPRDTASSRSACTCTSRSAGPAAAIATSTPTPRPNSAAAPRQDAYPDLVAREIALAAGVLPPSKAPVSTVFFGGGTPTLLAPARLGGILAGIGEAFGLAGDAEVTVEANPETVDAASLGELRAQGVTRVSFGMQSAVPHVLRTLDRQHQPGQTRTMRAMGARGRVRPHQPGPDLRHAGGERRRLAAVAGRGDRRRARSRLRLRADRRGGHPAGRQGAPRRDRRA